MPWIELSLDTTHEGVDWVCTLLATTDYTDEIRIAAYTERDDYPIRDKVQPCWTFAICLYLPDDTRAENIVELLSPLHRTGLIAAPQRAVVEEVPAGTLSPLIHRIGQRFVVLTPDAPYQSEGDEVTIRLKTTLAFGSGFHPATVISLQLLERHVIPAMNVLDLGSGSGILSVAIAKLGASVLALDNDTTAVQATQDAVDRNGVPQVTVMAGSLGCGSELGHWMGGNAINKVSTIQAVETFDLIVANILARVHIALAPEFRRALRRTDTRAGLLITAGFTTDYEDAVTTALIEAGFEVVDCERLDEWVALAHRLKGIGGRG